MERQQSYFCLDLRGGFFFTLSSGLCTNPHTETEREKRKYASFYLRLCMYVCLCLRRHPAPEAFRASANHAAFSSSREIGEKKRKQTAPDCLSQATRDTREREKTDLPAWTMHGHIHAEIHIQRGERAVWTEVVG